MSDVTYDSERATVRIDVFEGSRVTADRPAWAMALDAEDSRLAFAES